MTSGLYISEFLHSASAFWETAMILTRYGSSSERSRHFQMIIMADNPTTISAQMKET
jgi:hypothetical protein